MASTRGRWASPERTMVWTEPPPKTTTVTSRAPPLQKKKKLPVVYYLSRNGQLDHPHFMEVALSSTQGLFLRDVLDRLNLLRGDGIADRYSWSSKRSYKNGYVWHDLTADDLVHPAHANEYVLKGSELLLLAPPRPRDASAASSSSSSSGCLQDNKPAAASCRAARGLKNWSSFDLGEYRVAVRGGSDVDLCALDAATQTDERRRIPEPTTELGIDEISPPPSSSSPETLETLIKNDARIAAAAATTTVAPQCEVPAARNSREEEVGVIAGGRMRASAVLMQLISCGSVTVKDTDRRLPRGRSDLSCASDGFSGGNLDREYFSGSLVETKKTTTTCDDAHGAGAGTGTGELKRSSSYNADRCSSRGVSNSNRELTEEVDGVRASRCIPRKPKPPSPSPVNQDV